ncbi:MAG: hypothetical protein KDE47_20280 [Caldilineaceae bacterium]|nr:hypothetical protein [Caldilineaceae bacterium]MCB0095573.1 hypothetical protein [Caldilineaceae bacterium]MCB9147731.1 hypothetical protein [Caldilineaceae bacterium]
MTSYRSFILRVCNDEPTGKKAQWRYILLDSESQYRRGFTSLQQLFRALHAEICGETMVENAHIEISQAEEELLAINLINSAD